MHKQHGLTMIGFLACAVIAIAVALIGFQVVPAYTEYRGIMGAVRGITTNSQITSIPAARESFSKQAELVYITSLKAENLKISQEGGRIVITFSYEKRIKLVGNAYLVLEFNGDSRT